MTNPATTAAGMNDAAIGRTCRRTTIAASRTMPSTTKASPTHCASE
jgi:hypothetical protein